ncbi:hypothetical protein GCM10011354_08060 [Egicoccus halophilus]|uniref:DUF3105 domain-containing protein n=1 Tax=Egicoccus halophilus TaxID=1670830 RepID=A0A8J3A8B0_9ACTN|nr:hypothetical protein GCM10011354_08060 [Egicoccus halophilus]
MLLAGCDNGPQVVDATAAAAGGTVAGCEERVFDDLGPPTHLEAASAPPATELYAQRPATSGPHLDSWLAVGVYDGPVDERAVVHNLEHGGIVAWYDPAAIAAEDLTALQDWAEQRNRAGLGNRAGGGVLVAPFEDAPLSAPLALRAWHVGADCERFDAAFADAFLLEHFGDRGSAPEGNLAPEVARVLRAVER